MTIYIYFNGFWSGFHERTNAVHDLFFIDVMLRVYNDNCIVTHDINQADILIESTQTQNSLKQYKAWKHTYLFSGESYIRQDKDEYSCVLYGQRNHKNTVNVPLFVPYIHCSLGKTFQTAHSQLPITTVPKKDVLIIISNPSGHIRNKFIDKLEQSGLQITFGGNYKNNTNGPISHYYNTEEFNNIVKQHKFMISMENSQEDTYITEKVIHGIRAGTVPVYWGSNRIHDYINRDRILTLEDDIDTLITTMKAMTPAKWLDMVNNNKPFTEFGQAYTVDTIASHIRNILLPKPFPKLTYTVCICNRLFEPTRYKRLVEMCEEYAITNDMCTFISPTYKHTITDDIYSKYVRYDYMKIVYGKSVNRGDISLILNTIAAYEYIEKTFLDGTFLVLESDVIAEPSFNNFNECLNKLEGKEWSAISLGVDEGNIFDKSYCYFDGPYRRAYQIDVKTMEENTNEDLSSPSDKDVRFIRKFHTRCTDSHLFSYKGIKQMLHHFHTDTNYATPVDYYFINVLEHDMTVKYYWSSESYFHQASKTIEPSTIR